MTEPTPHEAVESYIADRKIDDLSEETLERYQTVLRNFADWLEGDRGEPSIDIEPATVNQYKLSMADEKATSTLQTELNIIHRFFRFCESNGLVSDLVSPRILLPQSDASRDEEIDSNTVEKVLNHLERFRYASRDHAMVALAWHTCMRRGALRSIDLEDIRINDSRIQLVSRQETGTRLKNGEGSERWVSINDQVRTILEDYISVNRIDVTDSYGRNPLFSTENGRISVDAITVTFYRVTRPCVYDSDCPDDTDPSDCEAAQKANEARHCPFSLSSHPCRRGAITHHLRNEVPKQIVSDRADVSTNILDKHYNQLTDLEKME